MACESLLHIGSTIVNEHIAVVTIVGGINSRGGGGSHWEMEIEMGLITKIAEK
jgi:hypothetical protein